jgi:hypothetical protein
MAIVVQRALWAPTFVIPTFLAVSKTADSSRKSALRNDKDFEEV